MTKKYQPIPIIITGLFIGIILLVNLNKSLYLHSHKLENGQVVFHAHPFDKHKTNNQGSHHKHSSVEYYYIDNINKLINDEVVDLDITIAYSDSFYITESRSIILSQFHNPVYLRGPPLMV